MIKKRELSSCTSSVHPMSTPFLPTPRPPGPPQTFTLWNVLFYPEEHRLAHAAASEDPAIILKRLTVKLLCQYLFFRSRDFCFFDTLLLCQWDRLLNTSQTSILTTNFLPVCYLYLFLRLVGTNKHNAFDIEKIYNTASEYLNGEGPIDIKQS